EHQPRRSTTDNHHRMLARHTALRLILHVALLRSCKATVRHTPGLAASPRLWHMFEVGRASSPSWRHWPRSSDARYQTKILNFRELGLPPRSPLWVVAAFEDDCSWEQL